MQNKLRQKEKQKNIKIDNKKENVFKTDIKTVKKWRSFKTIN